MTMSNFLMWLIVGVIILTAVILFTVVVIKSRKRRMGASSKAKVSSAWKHAQSLNDPVRKILEADKVLDLALTELGFRGTLGEKLKKAGPRFSDINAVWRAHKLRNTLAHETGAHPNNAEVSAAMRTFERAINDLL